MQRVTDVDQLGNQAPQALALCDLCPGRRDSRDRDGAGAGLAGYFSSQQPIWP